MSGDSAVGTALSGLAGTLAALLFVLVLAYGALRLMRAWQSRPGSMGASDSQLRFVRALPVGPRERVVLIEVDGERLLIGVSAGGVTLIKRLAPAAPLMADNDEAGA